MRIVCDVCNFSCGTFTAWTTHLLTPGHQNKTQPLVEGWNKELVMVIRPRAPQRSIGVTPNDLVWHYSSFGMISDVCFDKDKDKKWCFIQFDEASVVGDAVKDNHVKGVHLLVTKRTATSRSGLSELMENSRSSAPAPTPAAPPPPKPLLQVQTQLPSAPMAARHAYVPPATLLNGKQGVQPPAGASPAPLTDSHGFRVSNTSLMSIARASSSVKKDEKPPAAAVAATEAKKVAAAPAPAPAPGPAPKAKSPEKKKKPEEPPDFFTSRHLDLSRHYETSGLDIDQQLLHWLQTVTLDSRDMNRRAAVLVDLTQLIQSGTVNRPAGLPAPRLYPFGSYITGLGDKDSDLDVFIDYGPGAGSKQTLLYMTRQFLRGPKRGPGRSPFYKLVPISSARVPILKATHSSGIEVDLSFENITSVRNSELIAFYQSFDPRVKLLMLIVRYWGKFHGLTGSILVKNYALVLLVIVYLCRRGLAPSVAALQALCPPERVDGWNVAFSTDMSAIRGAKDKLQAEGILDPLEPSSTLVLHPEINPKTHRPTTRSLLAMVADFFGMFARLDYSRFVICSLTGEFLERSLFQPGYESELPKALDAYSAWACDQPPEPGARFDTRGGGTRPFCLQDPFQLSFNVGSCVREDLLSDWLACCEDGAERANAMLLQVQVQGAPPQRLFGLFVPMPTLKLSKKQRKKKSRLEKWAATALAARIANGVKEREEKMRAIRLVPKGFSKEALFSRFGDAKEVREADEEKILALWCSYVKDFFVELLRDGYKMRVEVHEVKPGAAAAKEAKEEGAGPEEEKKPETATTGATDIDFDALGADETESEGDSRAPTPIDAEGPQGHKRPLPDSPPSSTDDCSTSQGEREGAKKEANSNSKKKSPKLDIKEAEPEPPKKEEELQEHPEEKNPKQEEEEEEPSEAGTQEEEEEEEETPMDLGGQMEFSQEKLRSLLASLNQIPPLEEQMNPDGAVTVLSAVCHPHFNQNYRKIAEELKAEGVAAGGGGGTDPFRLETTISLRAIGKSEPKRMSEVSFEVYGRLQLLEEQERRGGGKKTPFFLVELPEKLFCSHFLGSKYMELLGPYLEYRVRQWMLFTD